MELYGKIVKLKAVEQEDIEMLRLLTNSPDYEKMIVGWSFPVSKKEQDAWFQTLKNTVDGIIRYTIHTEEDGPVGLIGLTAFDWKNGSASGLGMRIAKQEVRTRGLATDAWMTLLKFAFEELRLNRINGSALEYNSASLRVCEKVGFKIEGIQRNAIFKNGSFHNLVMMAVLKEDYEQLITANHYWDTID